VQANDRPNADRPQVNDPRNWRGHRGKAAAPDRTAWPGVGVEP
jgi:hypothetical protein